MKSIFLITTGVIVGSVITIFVFYFIFLPKTTEHILPFQTSIGEATALNIDFRRVLFTGAKSQLAVMSIPPGGEVELKLTSMSNKYYIFNQEQGRRYWMAKLSQ